MSARGIFPDGVVVDTVDLQRTERERSQQTKNLAMELSGYHRLGTTGMREGSGRVEGLDLGVAGSTVTVTAGVAYVRNGERVVVDTDQVGISLSDYADGVSNLIVVTYLEAPGTPKAHETDGTTSNTEVLSSFEIKAYTGAEFGALPESSNDLTLPSADRSFVLGTVLGNGVTAGVPNALVAGEVTQLTLDPVLSIEYASDTLEGVRLVSTNATTAGAGTIRLNLVDLDAGAYDLYFTAPGDTEGVAVNVFSTVSNAVTLTSGDTVTELIVGVDRNLMRGNAVGSTARTINIDNYYDASSGGRVWSASDNQHRAANGGASHTASNPHGSLSASAPYADIDRLRLGFAGGAAAVRQMTPRLTLAGGSLASRTLALEYRDGSVLNPEHTRVYLNLTNGGLEKTRNAWWDNVGNTWYKDTVSSEAYRYSFGEDGTTAFRIEHFSGTGPFADGSWVEVMNVTDTGVLTSALDMVAGGFVRADSYVEITDDIVGGMPAAARIYADTTVRAWGRVVMSGNGSGGITTAEGVGYTLVSPVATTYLDISFDSAFASVTEYAVSTNAGSNVASEGMFSVADRIDAQNMDIYIRDASDVGINLSTTVIPYEIDFIVVGRPA